MSPYCSKKFTAVIASILIVGMLAAPLDVSARGFFRDAFRNIKRTTRFIISLPDRGTRWMGPVLGPIASMALTNNILKHPNLGRIFRNAQRAQQVIQNVEEQKKMLADVQKLYRDQAGLLDQRVAMLRQAREELQRNFVSDGNLKNYIRQVVNVDELIKINELAAAQIRRSADQMGVSDIIKMVGNNAIKSTVGSVKNAVVFLSNEEVKKFVDPAIVKRFTATGGFTFDNLVDMLVRGDIDRLAQSGNLGDIDINALKDKVRERLKEILKENKDALKNNWNEKVKEVIKQMTDELKGVGQKLDNLDANANLNINQNTNANAEALEGENADPEELENGAGSDNVQADTNANVSAAPAVSSVDTEACKKANGGCACGYRFDPRSGVGCVQADCGKPEFSHLSYEGYCVCGSSGSINENPKDPNKECGYGSDNLACPGCVYACVHFEDNCPNPPNK